MSELEFVAFSDDGKMIILQSPDGNWIEVPIKDSPTSYAVPEEKVYEAELTPREIQSRIRAGVSPAELAAVTNSSLERIMSFAPPILLERSHVANKATKTVIRRASGSGTLGDIVNLKLESLGVDMDATVWDSFRREDGRWSVLLHYPADGATRTAAWLYDVRNNALVAADEDARWLTGDQHRATAEVEQVDNKVTEVVEFLAPVTQLNSNRPSHEQPTDTIARTDLEASAASDVDPAIDELLEVEDAATTPLVEDSTDLFAEPSVADHESVDVESTPTTADEFESLDDADAEETESNVSDIRPPKIPSWDEILFGPASTDH